MIDLSQLTTEQLWGLQYARQTANAPIQQANAALPDGEQPATLWTDQSYAEHVFRGACNSYFAELIAYKKQIVLTMIDSLTPEQQAALAQQFQVPDVIQS